MEVEEKLPNCILDNGTSSCVLVIYWWLQMHKYIKIFKKIWNAIMVEHQRKKSTELMAEWVFTHSNHSRLWNSWNLEIAAGSISNVTVRMANMDIPTYISHTIEIKKI